MKLMQQEADKFCLLGFVNNRDLYQDAWLRSKNEQKTAELSISGIWSELFVAKEGSAPFDAAKLPPFSQVSHHVGRQTGIAGVTQAGGWKLLLTVPRADKK
jgi:hypothetical protein